MKGEEGGESRERGARGKQIGMPVEKQKEPRVYWQRE